MTTPNGPIKFNTTSGYDTQASGLGPDTAVFGAGASVVSASASVTGIDTTGVSAGDLLWVETSTGRQFSLIQSITSSTELVCDDVFDVTESGRNWAIGGKRATFDNSSSRRLFGQDSRQDFIVETETDQTLASAIGYAGATSIIRSPSESKKRITITGVGQRMFAGGHFILRDLDLQATDSNELAYSETADAAIGTTTVKTNRCTIGGQANSFTSLCNSPNASTFLFMEGTKLLDIFDLSNYIAGRDKAYIRYIVGTFIKGCGLYNLYNNRSKVDIHNSIVCSGTANSFFYQRYLSATVSNCIFYDFVQPLAGTSTAIYASDSIFHTVTNPINSFFGYMLNCKVYNRTGTTAYPNATILELETLTEDPFVDAANNDFNINNLNAGGRPLRAASVNASNTAYTGIGGEKVWLCPTIGPELSDLSGNRCHATYYGGMGTEYKPGSGGGFAYKFESNLSLYMQLANKEILDFIIKTNVFSISLWAYTPTGVNTTQRAYLGCGLGANDYGFSLAELNAQGYKTRLTKQTVISPQAYSPDTRSTTAIPEEAWSHIAATVSDNEAKIYLNGVEVASQAGPFRTANTGLSSPLVIGKYTYNNGGSSGGPFAGWQDDIRIYNRTLSLEEVAHLGSARGVQGKP